ncbi:hypothetical protein AKJ09_00184 [Labilithrix luteola]|uniref:VWFA domain-containing protein n=1 Tax=Labilithrix luteola TaxID=1391654 RepID=A0A0K1PJ21_9BACT|nr:VWA domain-containing protein [Labilithrix luteola]AKU93520.1 hypothetical protein AKJ09_00184 [Labilithrix luteola]
MRAWLLGLLTAIGSVGMACSSSSDGSIFPDGGTGNGSHPGTSDTFGGSVTDDGGEGSSGGSSGNNGDAAACAVASAAAQLTPVNMVVMFDESGSMGDTTENPAYKPELRWIPVGDAMKAFFKDPESAGMSASITFFPMAPTVNRPEAPWKACATTDYNTAEVALSALPNAALADAITAHAPKGDTPTRVAVAGAIQQAQAIAAAKPTEKTVIVLVTDGEPYGCGATTTQQTKNELQSVVSEVSAVAATIPTYVIGVGPSVAALDAVATGGGTTAFHVDVGNPAKTSSDLSAALTAIRGNLTRCDFDIPAPSDGRAIDFNKVNVEFTPSGQATKTLPYSADCSDATGWHFDNAAAPKKVLLCDSACGTVRADTGGQINVSFRCEDRPDVIK